MRITSKGQVSIVVRTAAFPGSLIGARAAVAGHRLMPCPARCRTWFPGLAIVAPE